MAKMIDLSWFQKREDSHPENYPLLSLEDIHLRYDKIEALSAISFQILSGDHIALIGPNGAGKSTLIKIIAGLEKPTAGLVRIYGSDPEQHICIAYLPQRWQVDWSFPVSVYDVVMMGRVAKIGMLRYPKNKDKQLVMNALETVKLIDYRDRQINELSGGQKQRVFIARALAQEPELLLMDEPFTGLDHNAQEDVLSLIEDLKKKRVTMLISLHDLKIARTHFSRVALLNKTIIKEGSPEDVFKTEILTRAYQSHLHFIEDEGGRVTLSDMCCDNEADHA